MAVAIRTLVEVTQLASAITTYFTAGVATRIDKMTLSNVDAGVRFVSIYWIPAGGAANVTNQVIQDRGLQPGEVWDVAPMMGHVLTAGDQIAAVCDSAAAVNFAASGTAISS